MNINGKTLYKNTGNKMIFGVCSGIADFFELDPNIIRIGAVVAGFTGVGLVAYIVAGIILPEK